MAWSFPAAGGLYLLFCLLYARAAARRAESLQKGLLCLVLSLALPGAGPLLLLFCDGIGRRVRPTDCTDFYSGDDFCPEDLHRLQKPDLQAETDRVPMEEALLVSDLSYRREMVMGLLDARDQLLLQLDEAEESWRRAPGDADACARLEDLLYRVIRTDLFDPDVRRRLLRRHTDLTDRMLAADPPAEACLHHRIRTELRQGHCAQAQRLCNRYLKAYPHSEQAVRDQLEICVQAKNGAGLQKFLRGLRNRPVLLTASTLAWVRAFRKEGTP